MARVESNAPIAPGIGAAQIFRNRLRRRAHARGARASRETPVRAIDLVSLDAGSSRIRKQCSSHRSIGQAPRTLVYGEGSASACWGGEGDLRAFLTVPAYASLWTCAERRAARLRQHGRGAIRAKVRAHREGVGAHPGARARSAAGTPIFPDFIVQHRHDPARRAWIEIVGFWSPQYVAQKLERLRAARLPNLILCIDEDLACGDGAGPEDAMVPCLSPIARPASESTARRGTACRAKRMTSSKSQARGIRTPTSTVLAFRSFHPCRRTHRGREYPHRHPR
jgi:hypothetical protein